MVSKVASDGDTGGDERWWLLDTGCGIGIMRDGLSLLDEIFEALVHRMVASRIERKRVFSYRKPLFGMDGVEKFFFDRGLRRIF